DPSRRGGGGLGRWFHRGVSGRRLGVKRGWRSVIVASVGALGWLAPLQHRRAIVAGIVTRRVPDYFGCGPLGRLGGRSGCGGGAWRTWIAGLTEMRLRALLRHLFQDRRIQFGSHRVVEPFVILGG